MPYQPAANRYQAMVYRRCGRSGLQLPALSLGLWNSFGEGASIESVHGLICRAFDLGITISIWPTTTDRPRARRKTAWAGS